MEPWPSFEPSISEQSTLSTADHPLEVLVARDPVRLQWNIEGFATGWQSQIARDIKIETSPFVAEKLDLNCVAIKIPTPRITTLSFDFPESPQWQNFLQADKGPSAAKPASDTSSNNTNPKPPSSLTRIRPPKDLVKLEDRLYYVLQPPLETLVSNARLDFAFQPFPYQFEGIAFLFSRETAILADEMGLGKTMQAITTVRMLLLANQLRSVLLVCPKPLVTNWVREFRLWAPEIPVAVIEGDQSKRQWMWSQPGLPVRIANYELLMRDRDLLESNLHFDLVILDEAQRIKNRNSTTSEIARGISRSRSWALTGTPIENTPEDLVSIFEFLTPGYLRDGMSLKQMGQATRDHILRRTKDKVLTEMPPKLFRDAELDLTPEQLATYRAAEDEGVIQLSDMGQELTIQHVFELVLRLKQICNFDPVTGASCKLERLEADLEEVAASGQKAIVFSQWVQTLDRISDSLKRFNPLQYHGRIPSEKRDGVLKLFKEDPKRHVLLMSYGAGSVGLNLQFCRYVFLFDRWWNPAVEDQAINRAHRLGAAGSVTVTRMLVAQTIEERIHRVLDEKRSLFNELFAEAGTPSSLGLNQSDIFGLFNLKIPASKKSKAA
jgi:SNF2 family DNA or RNA helicase